MAATVTTGLKARVNRTELLKALKRLVKLTGDRTIPVLRSVRLETSATGIMKATTTDTETALTMAIPVDVVEAGVVVVGAKDLALVAEFSTGGDLHLSTSNYGLNVQAGADEFRVEGFGPDTFPDMPNPDDYKPFFSIGRADLIELAEAASITISKNDSKPWLTTIYLKAGETLTATTTDGYRVCAWDKPVEIRHPGSALIIPAAVKMAAQLAAPGETVQVTQDGKRLRFTGHNFEVIGRTLDAQYPDVLRLVPTTYPITAVMDREALISASRLASQWHFNGDMRMTVGDNTVAISASVPEKGEFTRRLPATASEPITCGFNSKGLLPMLKQFTGREVTLNFNGPRNPALITCADQPHLRYVILPLITY